MPEQLDGDRLDIAAKATSLAVLLTGRERLPALERAAHLPHAVVRIAAGARRDPFAAGPGIASVKPRNCELAP